MGELKSPRLDGAVDSIDQWPGQLKSFEDSIIEAGGLTAGVAFTGRQWAKVNASGEVTDPRAAGAITLAELVDGAAASILARAGATVGVRADLAASADGQVLQRAAGELAFAALTAAMMPSGIDATKLAGGTVDNTELGYLNGVTSAIQTQLAGKLSSSTFIPFSQRCAVNAGSSGSFVTPGNVADVSWVNEDFDTDGFHEGVTHPTRITIPTGMGGGYLIAGMVEVLADAADMEAYAFVFKNGNSSSVVVPTSGRTIDYSSLRFCYIPLVGVAALVAADYVELRISNVNASGNVWYGASTFLQALRIW